MPTTYRRAHTFTRNGKTFHRKGSTIQYDAKTAGKIGLASLGFAGLYTVGLPAGASLAVVVGVWYGATHRKQIAAAAKRWKFRGSKALRVTKKTAKVARNGAHVLQMAKAKPTVITHTKDGKNGWRKGDRQCSKHGDGSGIVSLFCGTCRDASNYNLRRALEPAPTVTHRAAPKPPTHERSLGSAGGRLHSFVSQTGPNADYCGACGRTHRQPNGITAPTRARRPK